MAFRSLSCANPYPLHFPRILTLTHPRTHTHTHTHALAHYHTPFLIHTPTHTYTPTHTLTHPYSHPHALSRTHTFALSKIKVFSFLEKFHESKKNFETGQKLSFSGNQLIQSEVSENKIWKYATRFGLKETKIFYSTFLRMMTTVLQKKIFPKSLDSWRRWNWSLCNFNHSISCQRIILQNWKIIIQLSIVRYTYSNLS